MSLYSAIRKFLGKSFREEIKKFRDSSGKGPRRLVTIVAKFYWEVTMHEEDFKMGAI